MHSDWSGECLVLGESCFLGMRRGWMGLPSPPVLGFILLLASPMEEMGIA